jgi:hypothetical protein
MLRVLFAIHGWVCYPPRLVRIYKNKSSLMNTTAVSATALIGTMTSIAVSNVTAIGATNTVIKTPKPSNKQMSNKQMLALSGTSSSQKKWKVDPFTINGTLQDYDPQTQR